MLSLLRHGLPFVLFLSLLVVGCDSGGSNDEANYLGTWERTDSNQYMNITEERMVVYARLTSDCYSTFTFEVIERNGEN